jgi:hypothetical protein
MRTHAVLAALSLMVGLAPAAATVRIANDTGGQIGPYLAKYRALKASGERVEIDGTCASACTMLLGIVPRNRICVTPRASLVFHSARDTQCDQAVRRRQPYFVVDLSCKCAPVDQIARRAAFSNYYTERTRTGGDVFSLPVTLPIIRQQ